MLHYFIGIWNINMNIDRRKTLFKDLSYHSIFQFMMNHFYLSSFNIFFKFILILLPFTGRS